MAHKGQILFLKENVDMIRDPILLVGSKLYDYDQFDLAAELVKLGFKTILGIDVAAGQGVDYVVDITDNNSKFIQEHANHFNTIVCMEVLTNVANPFLASKNIDYLLKEKGTLILSECFARKLSRMPVDYWRFTYDGFKALFPQYIFYDDRARISITREKNPVLKKYNNQFDEILAWERHPDESKMHYYIRRINRRLFGRGVFKISRWLPEQTIYAVACKFPSAND